MDILAFVGVFLDFFFLMFIFSAFLLTLDQGSVITVLVLRTLHFSLIYVKLSNSV